MLLIAGDRLLCTEHLTFIMYRFFLLVSRCSLMVCLCSIWRFFFLLNIGASLHSVGKSSYMPAWDGYWVIWALVFKHQLASFMVMVEAD